MADGFEITYTPHGVKAFSATIHQGHNRVLETAGGVQDVDPVVRGVAPYLLNRALVTNLWAFAKHEQLARRLRAEEKVLSHTLLAAEHRRVAMGIADMVERMGDDRRFGWCSGCTTRADHVKVRWNSRPRSTWLCDHCGTPTTPCLAPRCSNMATRGVKTVALPHYCAEHRHEIASFDKLSASIADIDQWDDWLSFERRNMTRATKTITATVLGGVAIFPIAWAAAPAIGGIIGSFTGLSGAAATSHGLALLGGGAIAEGGLGMAGGVKVVAAVGTALGGTLGGSTTIAYVGADPSFRVEKLRDGVGAPVLVASGFLTDKGDGWGPWQQIIDARYPERPVYRVHWGAKDLKALGSLAGMGASKTAAAGFAKKVAATAAKKSAGRASWLGWLLLTKDVVANPWTVASTRATATGAVLADLIARTDSQFVLVGHSLGGRVMATAATLLGTKSGTPVLEDVHILGAAVSKGRDWRSLDASVTGHVWNYWSTNDWVLGYLYPAGSGKKAVGRYGFTSKFPHIKDRNVSRAVEGHSGYFGGVRLQ